MSVASVGTFLTCTYPHTNTHIYTSSEINLKGEKSTGLRVDLGCNGHLLPASQARPSRRIPSPQWRCSPATSIQPPWHCTHPTPPILLIHKLTSPNRPPLPVTKITIFKIHSRAFAYTHCADWNLKGDMRNAVCG